ncbi:phage portal protein [Paenibacillus chitinolyticus]|uniref:phage portal protein n=1 Tax=Paenibacillus chitinolyticus TaxID=79263 RepID=UPI0026E4F0C0|nr:phage portal protein [Paenibacillus chitinolyticus]GKS14779.1 phage portal protein [Paenibacillus chitinolyticus]
MSWAGQIVRKIAPVYAAKRERAKLEILHSEAKQKILNQGYGDHGASRTKKALKSWVPWAGDADEDIHENIEVLRARTRDMYIGGPIANGALKAMRTNVIGTGLKLKPTIDAKKIGLTEKQARELKRQIKDEFNYWAESRYCDATGIHNFYELQQLAFLSWLQSGDCFALLPLIPERHSIYDLRIKIVEADRCSSPLIKELSNGNTIKYGVETNANGRVVAYHFSDRHPGSSSVTPNKWTRVESVGQRSGRRNVLHLMESERPDQLRGVPILAPVIEALKQLSRYTEAELMAAVISGMFTVFIETPEEDEQDGFGLATEEPAWDNPTGEPIPSSSNELKLGVGAVQFLAPGEKANIANPGRPNQAFDGFVTSVLRQIGSSLEIPYELLIKHFTSSYSASRAALLEAWKMFRMRRAWTSADFCQPIYEEWFVDAVVKGRINAPGIFNDPLLFRAYTQAEWHGPSQGLLNPVQEVEAAAKKVEQGFSTREREAAEMNGSDFEENAAQLAHEESILQGSRPSEGGEKKNEQAGTKVLGDDEEQSDE